MIPGFNRWHNIIQATVSSSHGHSVSLLEHRGEKIFVRPLNEPLEHVNASIRFALDETPVNPDAPMPKSYTTSGGVALSSGKASIWTLPTVLKSSREMLASLLLQRSESLSVDAAKFMALHDLCVAATENAQQCDDSWLNFFRIW